MIEVQAFLELGRWLFYGTGIGLAGVWPLFSLLPQQAGSISTSFRMLSFAILAGNILALLRSVETLNLSFGILDAAALLVTLAMVVALAAYLRSSNRSQSSGLLLALIVGVALHVLAWFTEPLLAFAVLISGAAILWLGASERVAIIKADEKSEIVAPRSDLAEQRRTWEQELAKERKRAAGLEQELEELRLKRHEFFTNMSHELRTPLNSVIGYSELLRTGIYGALNEQQTDRLERITRNGRYLSSLLNSILDLSRIESGNLPLTPSRFSVREVLDAVSAEYEPQIRQKGLGYEVDCASELSELVGDKERIRQIILNLVDNAFKFTNSGVITIRAQRLLVEDGNSRDAELPARGWLRNGEWVLISIQDTGVGISPELQQRIFEQFFQVDSTRTRENEGIGLGLTIARSLAEKHSGSLWLRSQVGRGTTFFVALPAVTMLEGRKQSSM